MSFHGSQTFVFGEQPSASKWQYLWDNDDALQDWSAFTNGTLPIALLPASGITYDKISQLFIQTGAITTPAASGFQSTAVTFPTTFAGGPRVFATANSAASAITNVQADSITASGCNIDLNQTNSTSRNVHWMAIYGMG